jgi:hypothetical protein
LISGVQNLDRGNSLIGLPNSLLGAIKFPARLNREFRRNQLRNRTFFIGFSANFAANHEIFPAFSLLAGNFPRRLVLDNQMPDESPKMQQTFWPSLNNPVERLAMS